MHFKSCNLAATHACASENGDGLSRSTCGERSSQLRSMVAHIVHLEQIERRVLQHTRAQRFHQACVESRAALVLNDGGATDGACHDGGSVVLPMRLHPRCDIRWS